MTVEKIKLGSYEDLKNKFGYLFAEYAKNNFQSEPEDVFYISIDRKNSLRIIKEKEYVIKTTSLNTIDWNSNVSSTKDSEKMIIELLKKTFGNGQRLTFSDLTSNKIHYDFIINDKTIDLKISKLNFEIEISRLDGTPSGIFNDLTADYWLMVYPSFDKNNYAYNGSISFIKTSKWRELLKDIMFDNAYLIEYPDPNDFRGGRKSVRIPYEEIVDVNSHFFKNRVFIGEIQAFINNNKIEGYDFSKFTRINTYFDKLYKKLTHLNFMQCVDKLLNY